MRITVVGAGNQGLGFAAQVSREPDVESVLLLDYDPQAAEAGRHRIANSPNGTARIETGQVDATNEHAVASAARGSDLVLNATLPEMNGTVMRACLRIGTHYLDLYAHPDGTPNLPPGATLGAQTELDGDFKNAGLLAVPSLGVNPGWVNVIAADMLADLDHVESLRIRDIEWIDSDEMFCSGPPDLHAELFLGEPGPTRLRRGTREPIDLVEAAERYVFPDPIGEQEVLPTAGLGTSEQLQALRPGDLFDIAEERFAVLSAGLTMQQLLLTALARGTAAGRDTTQVFELIGSAFIPTTEVDMSQARASGRIRNAAWASSVEVTGTLEGVPVRRTTTLLSTFDQSLAQVPWAPPGVTATTAMPVETALRLCRGQIADRGVRPAWQLQDSRSLSHAVTRRGVTLLESVDQA
jgi:hypothetical protein